MTNTMHRVVVIEHDIAAQSLLRTLLEEQGFRVILADNYARGVLDARAWRPDIIIVNVGVTDHRGIEFIRTLREWSAIPILALSAPATLAQRLEAFDVGADDYVEVPFSGPELAARIRAILRRHARNDLPQAMLKLGDINVDLERRLARHRDGRKVRLTPLEHRMLEILARYPDRMITHSQLISEVWGPDMADVCAVRVYIASLRRKLESDPHLPKHIITEFGIGYSLITDSNGASDAMPNLTNMPLAGARRALASGSHN
jgi:two-component system, OmpR family, KDP operon response regulator KdpE